MNWELIVSQVVAGVATGALYFFVATGLTLIWGALDVVNLAHGSFYMIAAFATTTAIYTFGTTTGLLIAILVIPVIIAAGSIAAEMTLFRRVYESGVWGQLLVSFGLVLVLNNLVRTLFGPIPRSARPPDFLLGFLQLGGIRIAKYQLAIIAASILVGLYLWYLLTRSRIGKLIRAAVDDPKMLEAMGVDVARLRTKVMGISALLAALAGVIAAPFGSVVATLDVEIVIIAFAVIVVGGLGSVGGALVAAILIGVSEAVSTIYIDRGSEIVIFAVMALVLFFRPTGFRTIAGREA